MVEEREEQGGVEVQERSDDGVAEVCVFGRLALWGGGRKWERLTRVGFGEEGNHAEEETWVGEGGVRLERGEDTGHEEHGVEHVVSGHPPQSAFRSAWER